jgi:hypothetical protein
MCGRLNSQTLQKGLIMSWDTHCHHSHKKIKNNEPVNFFNRGNPIERKRGLKKIQRKTITIVISTIKNIEWIKRKHETSYEAKRNGQCGI